MSLIQIPIDLTGLQDGDTLRWDASEQKFVPGEPLISSLTVSHVDDLPSNPADGAKVNFKVGSGANKHKEVLIYDAEVGRWIGEIEYILATQDDTWAMDLGNRNTEQLPDWSPISNTIPFGKAFAMLDGPLDLDHASFAGGTGVITVNDTSSPHSFPFTTSSGSSTMYVQIRDNYISHTGKTGTTLTGCTLVQGTGGTIPDTEYVTQTVPGGAGFNGASILYAGELFAGGLTLQVNSAALMNSSQEGDDKAIIAGPYWRQYDQGDGIQPNTLPLTGGLGIGQTLTSTESGDFSDAERSFYVKLATGWQDWALARPTKHMLTFDVMAKMAAGSQLSGQVLDYEMSGRWAY